jgi:hypothetical protein
LRSGAAARFPHERQRALLPQQPRVHRLHPPRPGVCVLGCFGVPFRSLAAAAPSPRSDIFVMHVCACAHRHIIRLAPRPVASCQVCFPILHLSNSTSSLRSSLTSVACLVHLCASCAGCSTGKWAEDGWDHTFYQFRMQEVRNDFVLCLAGFPIECACARVCWGGRFARWHDAISNRLLLGRSPPVLRSPPPVSPASHR